MTRVQRAGSTNNLITLTRFDEAVQFVYYNDVWQFDHNVAFVEPIYFSGTNAVANAAASRTNLGLGATNDVTFETVNVDQLSWEGNLVFEPETGIFWTDIGFENPTNAAITRTNLGLPLPALTNTNNANFQAAVFNTNTTPAGSAFNTIVAWMEVHVFTNGSNTSFRIPLFK
jgi:hypothetical protein